MQRALLFLSSTIHTSTTVRSQSTIEPRASPYILTVPFPSIVSFAAYAFYPNFFSNGTYGAGGVANYESISSIIGAKYNPKTNEFEYVPERWPENWYRRDTEYGAVEALTQGLVDIYTKNPIGMPIAQVGTPNLNVTTILCDVYQGINSVIPLFLAGTVETVDSALTAVLSILDPAFKDTVLGCPTSTLSNNFLFPSANETGGPLSPPPSVLANTGNNVYNRTYFTSAPEKPQCNHVS
jgi:hypothetical protein